MNLRMPVIFHILRWMAIHVILEGFEAVVRCMKESGVGYGSINHPVRS